MHWRPGILGDLVRAGGVCRIQIGEGQHRGAAAEERWPRGYGTLRQTHGTQRPSGGGRNSRTDRQARPRSWSRATKGAPGCRQMTQPMPPTEQGANTQTLRTEKPSRKHQARSCGRWPPGQPGSLAWDRDAPACRLRFKTLIATAGPEGRRRHCTRLQLAQQCDQVFT